MKEYRAERPLVIGHQVDELLMARCARDLGGLSIGFNPDFDVERQFDVIVKARDWTPILSLFKDAFSTNRRDEGEHEQQS